MSDLTGKIQLIGEWSNGLLSLNEERRILNAQVLSEIIQQKASDMDLQLLLAGMIAVLGISRDEEHMKYALEICVPLMMEEGEEYNLDFLSDRMSALMGLKNMGFYLAGDRDGMIRCYKEGDIEQLEDELSEIGSIFAK
ncbi:MAG: hypothetical protein GX369_05265 [Euryarchaeota archaeon]|nr:hypothetical protein [Euryarchaeota archaeon]